MEVVVAMAMAAAVAVAVVAVIVCLPPSSHSKLVVELCPTGGR